MENHNTNITYGGKHDTSKSLNKMEKKRLARKNAPKDIGGKTSVASKDNPDATKHKDRKGHAWRGFCQKIKKLLPFMWPKGSRILQLRVVLCVFILVATRVVTVFVPLFQKKIVDSLTYQPDSESELSADNGNSSLDGIKTVTVSTTALSTSLPLGTIEFRWDYILIYIILRSLRSGYLGTLRTVLWIGVSQNTKKRMRLQLFSHLHNLSLQWHLHRKTGEVLRVMDRGVNSISTVLSHVLFNIIPVFADVLIGIVYFVSAFNVWIGLIVFGAMLGYLVCTVLLTEWRTKYRRLMNETDNEKSAASVDSILNFETVKYYAAEDWEVNRYADVVDKHLHAEWLFIVLSNMVSSVQQTIIGLGLLGGSLLCAWYVHMGHFTVGDYVLFASYVEYMYGPLGNFGNQYRLIQQSFIDMENMFEMLSEDDQINDDPDAKELELEHGDIEFKEVSFAYTPERIILHDINFHVAPGKTVALVGHTGSGKSTILRLLLRFYDVTTGSITIDGQAVNKVKQKSLRRRIGVVPQDTVLFNNTIRYNVRYGRVEASDDKVEEATAAANIHDRIMSFPDGYDSRVGERGLKLSGGEKQRVAIARTLLKDPAIVLLDEATSALDTKTERTIQASLAEMCTNRTTIIVAHRLSTIVHADQILVLHEGRIIERGSHTELMEVGETYAEMWREQQKEADELCADTDTFTDDTPSTRESEDGSSSSLKEQTVIDIDTEASESQQLLQKSSSNNSVTV